MNVFEGFSGYGSQYQELKNLGIEVKPVGISEVEPDSIIAYAHLHGKIVKKEAVSHISDEKMRAWLKKRNIGWDFKKEKSRIDRMPKGKMELLFRCAVGSKCRGDISKINWAKMKEDIDLFTYSFPCQSISQSGLMKGLEEGSGTTSSLLWECKRAIEIKRPKILMMENVKNLVGKKFKPEFDKWLNYLETQGYVTKWKVINGKHCGVPQNRERVFAVSFREDIDSEQFHFEEDFDNGIRLRDVLEDNVDESYYYDNFKTKKLIEAYVKRYGEEPIPFTGGEIRSDEGIRRFKSGSIGTIRAKDSGGDKIVFESIGCAVRGRNPKNPTNGKSGLETVQMLEVNETRNSNCLTTVSKDSLVLEKIKNDILTVDAVQAVRVRKHEVDIEGLKQLLSESKKESGLSIRAISDKLNVPKTKVEHWFRKDTSFSIPDENIWTLLKSILGITTDIHDNSILEFETRDGVYEKGNRVYFENGISPTLTCDSGIKIVVSDRQFLTPTENGIEVREATKLGYKLAKEGDSVNLEHPNSKTRRSRVGKDVAQTLTTSCNQGVVVSSEDVLRYRVRKLTPRECFRLMGLSDPQIDRIIASGVSKSAMYKLAGNSIITHCMAFLKNLPKLN